ncbi:MAG: TetR/AcrR family transcriptional regulator [Pseudomonadota bacterium]
MSDLRAKRRVRLIETAKAVFVAEGFRGATMEGIAAAAQMSKVTLYSYFPDKPALFDAVAETVAHDLVANVNTQLDNIADPADAVIAALTAKHMYVHSLVRTSQFAEDLFRAKDTVSAAHFKRADTAILNSIASRLSRNHDDSQERAALLLAASQGIANATQSQDALCHRIAELKALLCHKSGS